MTETKILTKDEIYSGYYVGKHILESTIRVKTNGSIRCECPKLKEKKLCDNFFPDSINHLFRCYRPVIYKIFSVGVFEIPKGATLIRPYRTWGNDIEIGPDPEIRTNQIQFKGFETFPSSFSQEEIDQCECYPYQNHHDDRMSGRMFRVNTYFERKEDDFFVLHSDQDGYDRFFSKHIIEE